MAGGSRTVSEEAAVAVAVAVAIQVGLAACRYLSKVKCTQTRDSGLRRSWRSYARERVTQ